MRATALILVLFLVGSFLQRGASANGSASATGLISVYADLYQGRATASGVPYDRAALTAAHATLPFGTRVRVANFESGRMVDLLVNDRKREDGRLLTISRAAADLIGLAPNRTAPGSLIVLQAPVGAAAAPAPMPVAPTAVNPAAVVPPAGAGTLAASSAQPRKFRPLAGWFGKEAGAAPSANPSPAQPVAHGLPGERFVPPAVPKAGGLFASKSAVPAAKYPDPIPIPHGVVPAAPGGELMAMNARSGVPQMPQMPPMPQTHIPGQVPAAMPAMSPPAPAPMVNLPPASASAPYRAQFGAFRRIASAEELSAMLDGAGIPTSVFAAPGTSLNVVVTDGGFRTAEEAQRWIDFEGARRGWTERPVVIR